MKTVILEVRSPEEGMAEFAQAWKSGKPHRAARIGFATPELLWKVLSAKRWELLKALCGAGPGFHPRSGTPRSTGCEGRAQRRHGSVVRRFAESYENRRHRISLRGRQGRVLTPGRVTSRARM